MTEAPITSCSPWALCASTEDVTDTPIAAPMLRNRLNSDAPSVRSAGSSVANASTCNGVNTSPRPAPCTTIVSDQLVRDTSGVQPVMIQNDQHISSRPVPTSSARVDPRAPAGRRA